MSIVDVMRLPSAGREESSHRFDYKGQHRYIVTLPAFLKRPLFTEQGRVFTLLGRLRDESAAHGFDVYAYCFLPTRLLLIIRGKDEVSDMKGFLSAYRGVTNELMALELHHPVWSKRYIERVLRKGEESRDIAKQIFLTPVTEGLAKTPSDYPFLGSFVVPLAKIFAPTSFAHTGHQSNRKVPPSKDNRRQGKPAGRQTDRRGGR